MGSSAAIRDLWSEISRIARTHLKVLITGESGVGKELIARSIHENSPRSRNAFVAVNCAGIPETLLESELFGHVRGSFTGAHRDTRGKLELAHGGTILLDEIGETTPRMQAILLRFLETGEIQKVGADHAPQRVDTRVLAATNKPLRELVNAGTFRRDLYHRLNVFHVEVPALRERPEDIPDLLRHFMTRNAAVRPISPEAMNALSAYEWPGNVRELENVVERLSVLAPGEAVQLSHLPPEIRRQSTAGHHSGVDRRRSVPDALYSRMVKNGEPFWTAVYGVYMSRDITRDTVRAIVRCALQDARGNYRSVLRIFNLPPGDYKRLMNFLRKHDCHLPYREYR